MSKLDSKSIEQPEAINYMTTRVTILNNGPYPVRVRGAAATGGEITETVETTGFEVRDVEPGEHVEMTLWSGKALVVEEAKAEPQPVAAE